MYMFIICFSSASLFVACQCVFVNERDDIITEPHLHLRYVGSDSALMCSLSVFLWMEGITLLPNRTCTFAM